LGRKLTGSGAAGKSGPRETGVETDLAPGLYVTATPIGNASDITLRALNVLKHCDLIAAEDTRVTGKLLLIHGIEKKLTAYNDHNAARERPKLIARLRQGAVIALVSDAGTPLISDPGFKLVREVIQEGLTVHAIPGPSAVMTALALAGLPTDRFVFAGFLPVRSGERKTALAEVKDLRATLVFFESAQRLAESLADMAEVFGIRTACVARELTKLHEETRRGLLHELAAHYEKSGAPKGEVTLIVSPPHEAAADMRRVDRALDQALAFMPLRAAVDLVSEMLEAPRRAVYERALAKKDDG
jgi:16S rRNA (cytidine1402-2'-O)-methyltransferase